MSKTKCVVIGNKARGSTPKKKIVFSLVLAGGIFRKPKTCPDEWDNVILLRKDGGGEQGMDTMYVYDNRNPQNGYVYRGHWNDGVA